MVLYFQLLHKNLCLGFQVFILYARYQPLLLFGEVPRGEATSLEFKKSIGIVDLMFQVDLIV